MTPFPHLAQQIFNVPLMLQPEKAEIIVAALADRLGVTHLFRNGNMVFGPGQPMMYDDDSPMMSPAERAAFERGYDVCDGVAQICIHGTLVQRLGVARPFSGMTGYDGIRNAVLGAYADPAVRAIALNINSPGGVVAGCFDLVDMITVGRSLKPTWAILNENACSAAYAIASAAKTVIIPRTGMAGSIGVICMHADYSGALSKEGIAVNLIFYGAHKADGAESKPLSDSARASFQSDVDKIGSIFVNTVARNRGTSADAIRKTEADVYMGQDAVAAGLADAVMAPDEAHRALLKTLN